MDADFLTGLTCVFADQCRIPGMRTYPHSDPNHCCAYWKCHNGRSYGDCCGEGYSYDPYNAACVPNPGCRTSCPYKTEMPGNPTLL